MARVPRLPHELGALDAIWPEPSAALLRDALAGVMRDSSTTDARLAAGQQRGGRLLGEPTAHAVARAMR